MNENSQPDDREGVGEDRQQQQEPVQHHDEEVGMIIHDEIREDSTIRGERRREYRRRMTLDPLVNLLDDGAFFDAGDTIVQNEAETDENEDDHQIVENEAGGAEGTGMRNENDAAASSNNSSEAAVAEETNRNISELELLGELLGRYARRRRSNRYGDDSNSMSSDGEYGNDDENNNVEPPQPPQPPRNHSYLPTAQPLYPEKWIPAGQHRHRLGTGNSDISIRDTTREECANEVVGADKTSEGDAASGTSDHCTHGDDRERRSPYYYSIPEPPSLLRSHFNETVHNTPHEALDTAPTQSECTADLTALAIMEMEDVVLFPGSVIPLRLHDRNWVTYLGQLIDDTRGLYGPHQGTARGLGEVRIVILPRLSTGTRRTRRRQREGGGRTGRWRVDLIRRGVTATRRLSGRRRRSESMDINLNGNPSRNEDGSRRTSLDERTALDVGEVGRTRRRQSPLSETSSSDEENEVDLFRPTFAPRVPNDPWIGRIGTMATITFTHEEDTSAANPNESLVAGTDVSPIGGRSLPSHTGRPSSMVWRGRGGELVVTVLGTNRVRLIRSIKDKNSRQGRDVQIPIYVIEEMHDGSTTLPPSWMLRPPGDIRCTIETSANEPFLSNEEDREDTEVGMGCNSERRARHEWRRYNYNSSIRNLSLRSSVPAIAYQATWPWVLCQKIYDMIKENDEFQGLSKILHLAAGLRFAVGDGNNDNQIAKTTDETDMASPPTQVQVVDPPAFANWIATNMPLSQNDRLDLLEMICTVEQLRCILQKLKDKKQQLILRCKHCGAAISHMRHVFSVGGSEGTTGAYVNEHGVVHQTVTIRKVDNHSVVCIGQSSTKDSWFPGYSWTIAYCAICSDHLGWKFRQVGKSGEDDPDRPHAFWGFSSITTDNHFAPRRVPFQTQRALGALLQHS